MRLSIISIAGLCVATVLGATLVSAQSTSTQTVSGTETAPSGVACPAVSANLGFGARGGAVFALQEFLFARGYFSAHIAGPFGPLTRAAVVRLQRDNGIPPTGFVGVLTRAAISRLCDPAHSGPVSISSLSPSVGPVGTTVTVTGSGFTGDNTVQFGYGAIVHVAAQDSSTLVFTVPNELNPACFYASPRCLPPTKMTAPGTYAVTIANENGRSNAKTFTVTGASATTHTSLESMSPMSGPIGTTVTLTGKFFSNNNIIHFGNGAIGPVGIDSSIAVACTTDPSCIGGIRQTIHFTVPDSISPYCAPGMMCAMYMQLVTPGAYTVYVTNENGTTNSMTFTVTGTDTSNGPITISGLDAPTTLAMGVSGTWTVRASVPSTSGQLHYSVVWGDEAQNAQASVMAPQPTTISTSASFSHAYNRSGTFTPVFTVTDDAGHSATVSSTVTITPWY